MNAIQRLRARFRRATPSTTPATLGQAVAHRLEKKQTIQFIHIGSHDGLHNDSVHEMAAKDARWRGIFVEPVPYLFARLVSNYKRIARADERFVFENVAIGTNCGTSKFYFVDEAARSVLGDSTPVPYDQIGSFDRNHIVKHWDGLLEPYIVEAELPTMTVQGLLDKHHVQHIDVVYVDTEGFDDQVVAQIDLKHYRPSVIVYEHFHVPPERQRIARDLLSNAGYTLSEWNYDTLALARD